MAYPLQSAAPSGNFVKLAKSASELARYPRALWVGTAGTANITDTNGNDADSFPLLQGLNPIGISKLRAGGTADDIWALY